MASTIGRWNPAWGPEPQWQGPAEKTQRKRYYWTQVSCPCSPEEYRVRTPEGAIYHCARCGAEMTATVDGRRPTHSVKVGERYGRLVIENLLPDRGRGKRAWVRCDCGTTKAVWVKSLRSGATKSCGCYRRERLEHHPWRQSYK